MSVWPGVAILLTVLSINLIGEGLNDAMNPSCAAAAWETHAMHLMQANPGANPATRDGAAPLLSIRDLSIALPAGGDRPTRCATCPTTCTRARSSASSASRAPASR